MIKRILVAMLVAIPMLASAQGVKIGLVDTQSVVMAMPDMKKAQDAVATFAKEYEDEFGKLRQEAEKKLEEFQNLPATTSDLTKQRKAKEIEEYQTKLMEFEQMAQQAISKKQEQEMSPILDKVRSAIQAVGKEGNYTLIQELGSVLYFGSPAEDITAQVRARLGLPAATK